MRVISGILKGRNIKGFTIDGTRPTMDRVKESLFGSIQNYIPNSICLDLFAGSGSLGIEAISNGAKKCYFVDKNKIAINTINENIKSFNIQDKSIIIQNDYNNALKHFKDNNIKFDVIFLDPPYDMHIIDNILKYISINDLLLDNGIVVCEVDNKYLESNYNNLDLIKEKKYGTTYVYIYVKSSK